MMTNEEIQLVADQVLQVSLGESGFDHAEVSAGEDHSGERAIFVTAHFREGAGITDGGASLNARVHLMNALQDKGENRFPYLRFSYADDVPPLGEDEHIETARG